MAVTQPIFKLEPPDFAWQQIQIISTDDNNDDNNNNNNKNHKSFEASSVIPRFNRKIKQIQNLTVTSMMMMMTMMSTIFYLCKTRKRSLKINRNSHRLELETPPKDYTLAHWSTQYENQFTLSFFYSGKKNKQKHRFP